VPDFPYLETDENKVSQILKNFFVQRDQVHRVTARSASRSLAGRDDGIVIVLGGGHGRRDRRRKDHERIFEEFVAGRGSDRRQSAKGHRARACRCRAGWPSVMGGEVRVESALGEGLDVLFRPSPDPSRGRARCTGFEDEAEHLDPSRSPVLVVEDDRQTLFLYERYLRGSGFQVIPARTLSARRGRLFVASARAAVVLDVMLDGESHRGASCRSSSTSDETRDIPVLVVTVTNREQKARALGADEFCVKPMDRDWFMRRLQNVAKYRGTVERVLVIDDDEVSRYLIRKMLAGSSYRVLEAANARDGIEKARRDRPHIILLDFVLPNATAFDVLDELKVDPQTRSIPVLIQTSKQLTDDEKSLLARDTASVIPKQSLNREVAIARIREALLQSGDRAGQREPSLRPRG
jgi:CheY-like chemotaxis protein